MSENEKKILGLASGCHSVNHLFFESLGPLLPFIIPTFNLSYTQAGRLGFTYRLVYDIFNLPLGYRGGYLISASTLFLSIISLIASFVWMINPQRR